MYIVCDIGGTKMRIAKSLDCKSFGDPIKSDTPKDFDEAVSKIVENIKTLSDGGEIKGISIGLAGVIDRKTGILMQSPNLSSWVGKSIKEEIEKKINAPVFVENDTVIVGMGEAHSGAGRGHEIVAYITVSTGVGGARIVSGKPDERALGFEPGHQIIDMKGLACEECSAKNIHPDGVGHLEGYVSGTAVERRFGKKPYEISQDDKLWDELATWLAVGLNNTIVYWSPDVIVLGGSMIVGDPAILVPKIEEELKKITKFLPSLPEIKKAELGDEGGLFGGLAYLRQELGLGV